MTSPVPVPWPERTDTEAWAKLANRAMQLETYETDVAESVDWAKVMQALIAEDLDYQAFTARRLEALRARLRRRKLAQSNLRYKYGFRGRTARLVREDVKRYLAARSSNAQFDAAG